MEPIVTVRNLSKRYRARTDIATLFSAGADASITAVDGVSFELAGGEAFGLVGESGSGKTTIGRLMIRLEEPDGGEIHVGGRAILDLRGRALKEFYRSTQMIFQDPYGSLNPRFTVLETLMDPVKVQELAPKGERVDWIAKALARAGLTPASEYFNKYPHELSGGQRQRLSIARALVMKPRLIIADEPVSMLDVSIKAGILNLLKSLAQDDGVTILYISHDLSTVKYLCQRTAIMYRGRFVEMGLSESVIDRPQHPYARALKAAIPIADPQVQRERVIPKNGGEVGLPVVQGCRYLSQCPEAMENCAQEDPAFRSTEDDHLVACHLY